MEYGDDPQYFSQHHEEPFLGLLKAIVATNSDDAAWKFLDDDPQRLFLLTILWSIEVDGRLGDEADRELTQFEFGVITRRLMGYADRLGVYAPSLWELFCELTKNPIDPPVEQVEGQPSSGADRLAVLVDGELQRIRMAAGANLSQTPSDLTDTQQDIVQACKELFEEGVDQPGQQAIADKAGVSLPTVKRETRSLVQMKVLSKGSNGRGFRLIPSLD